MAFYLSAQECTYYLPVKEGSMTEMTSYDGKGKISGKTVQKVVKKEYAGTQQKIKVSSQYFNPKGELQSSSEFEYSCRDGVFYMDMKQLLDPGMMKQYENMQVSVTAGDLGIPGKMAVGDELPQSSLSMSISNNGIVFLNFSIKILNRKVVAKESITTPAGTYECYKISYDIETDMGIGMKITSKAIEWTCPNIGSVKNETYDQKGTLLGYSLLTKFTN